MASQLAGAKRRKKVAIDLEKLISILYYFKHVFVCVCFLYPNKSKNSLIVLI